jgi:AcrR family transcriptional regulator
MKRRYATLEDMARPAVYDDDLRMRLLESTAALIDRHGPDRVALRDVASLAGTSTSAVYALFGGKSELLAAVIEHAFRSFGQAQHDAETAGVRALGEAYRAWALAHPALFRLMFGDRMPAEHAAVEQVAVQSLEPLARTVSGIRSDPAIAQRDTIVIWAQVHGAVALELAQAAPGGVDWDAVYAGLLDVIERSLS